MSRGPCGERLDSWPVKIAAAIPKVTALGTWPNLTHLT